MKVELQVIIPLLLSLVTIIGTMIGIYVRFSNKVERIEERLRGDKALIDQKQSTAEESITKTEHRLDALEKAIQENTIACVKLCATVENLIKRIEQDGK